MRLYNINEMVKAGCQDCVGCFDCCCKMGDSIVLDPLDIYHLMQCLHMTFEEMLKRSIALHVTEGLILPHIRMTGEEERCTFLSDMGRCSIHQFRPGLCRTFPLGRQYMDGKMAYFLLDGACTKKQHSKVKIHKWIAMQDISHYEDYLVSWHYFLTEQKKRALTFLDNEVVLKNMNMSLLQHFYMIPYDMERSFISQYEERMKHYEQCEFIN